MTQEFVRVPALGAVTPDPNPTVSSTITTAVTQAITVSIPSTAFNGVSNPYDFHTVETDSENGGLKTSTLTSDEYYGYSVGSSSTAISFLGSTSASSDGVDYATTIGTGNGLVDVLPETTGPIAPANNAAVTTSETNPDASTDMRVTAADGSYKETDDNSDGTVTSAADKADGSGSLMFPLGAPLDSSMTVSAPSPNPKGTPLITIVFTEPAALVNPNPTATPYVFTAKLPVWYKTPVVLSTQSLADTGTAAIPASCNVPAALTTSVAHQIVQTTTSVDPVFGETDVDTQTDYTEPGIGVACTILGDTVTQYYDFSGQTEYAVFFSFTPIQTTTTTEVLGITSETVLGLSSVGRRRALAESHAALRASVAHFRAVLAKRRAARHLLAYRALVATMKKGHR